MFCVIQEVQVRKPNRYGEYRQIEVYQETWTVGDKPARWCWQYTGERFERPHMEAYKISLHQSYREHGKVRKRQYSVTTMGYYDVLEFGLYDCASRKITSIAEKTDIDEDVLYALIEAKLTPLREIIEAEFHQTEEYRVAEEHRRILAEHQEVRSEFCQQYEVDSDDYDRCYDLYGKLRNEAYLRKIVRQHRAAQKARRNYEDAYRQAYSNFGSYGVSVSGTYREDERIILKQFYRVLSKKFHPDLNPDRDTTGEMKLLNRLKQEWGV